MESINVDIKFDTAADFLESFIKNLANVMLKNFEFFSLSTFVYAITLERYMGRTYLNYEDAMENFIKNTLHCVKPGKQQSKKI